MAAVMANLRRRWSYKKRSAEEQYRLDLEGKDVLVRAYRIATTLYPPLYITYPTLRHFSTAATVSQCPLSPSSNSHLSISPTSSSPTPTSPHFLSSQAPPEDLMADVLHKFTTVALEGIRNRVGLEEQLNTVEREREWWLEKQRGEEEANWGPEYNGQWCRERGRMVWVWEVEGEVEMEEGMEEWEMGEGRGEWEGGEGNRDGNGNEEEGVGDVHKSRRDVDEKGYDGDEDDR